MADLEWNEGEYVLKIGRTKERVEEKIIHWLADNPDLEGEFWPHYDREWALFQFTHKETYERAEQQVMFILTLGEGLR